MLTSVSTSRSVRRTLFGLILVPVALAVTSPAKPAAQTGYTLTELPSPATDVNDNGEVVGQWIGPNGSRGYRWTQVTGPEPIVTDAAIINRFPCAAPKINANGTIVAQGSGGTSCGQAPMRAARYRVGGGLELGSTSTGDNFQTARAVNATGTAVGVFSGNNMQPFVWPVGGPVAVPFPFNIPFGAGGAANDVNDASVVVGRCSGDSFSGCAGPADNAFWWQNDVRTLLPKTPGHLTANHEALAINNNGHIVGRYQDAGPVFGAFLSTIATVPATTIDLLAPPGSVTSMDINDDGDIIATINPPGGGSIPYLYRDGVWTDINTLRPPGSTLQLATAVAINSHGWIVGSAAATSAQGYVLIPPPVASAPTASDSTESTLEDTPVSGTLSATDPNGDTLMYAILTNGARGTAVITNVQTGAFTYTPNANESGTDTFTFMASDDALDSNAATVTVTISPVNDAPEATDSAFPAIEDTPTSATFQATDVDNATLTFSIVANGSMGSAIITNAATGAFTYTPNLNANGPDTVTFQASDGTLTSNVGTFTLNIAPVNDRPIAADGSLAVTEDVQATGTFVASDVDSAALTFSIVTNGTRGTAVITDAATGAFTYTPNASATGADSVRFQASDGLLASNVATVSVTIEAVDGAPVAQAGVVTTPEGTPVSGTLAATDPDGGALTFSLATQPAGGTVVLDNPATGAFTYTPHPGTFGYDPFTFQVSDGPASSQAATQMVFVTASSPRWPGGTARASVSSAGGPANGTSLDASVSADGRYVAFQSQASTLVAGDTNGAQDVFVHDRVTATTTRVSVSSGGVQANSVSQLATISSDGRFVAFSSFATNLVADDTNDALDVFVHDRMTGDTTRVSVATDGAEGNSESSAPSISADGRTVAFWSNASNLVVGDTNGVQDVFVHDRVTGQTTRVSVASAGAQGNGFSADLSISADGRYVAFRSAATNLVAGDTNVASDMFVHDRRTGSTTRVSVASNGTQGNAHSLLALAISADGRFVAFESLATNLAPGDTNGVQDVFVHDRVTGTTTRVSVASDGAQGNNTSVAPSISADGRYVAFRSTASNLVAGDTNGVDDAFVYDRLTGTTTRVSVTGSGAQSGSPGEDPTISADGRFITFHALTPLVPDDTNGTRDVFVVGGVLVTPPSVSVGETGGMRTIDVSFAYPGTPWTAVSHASWITITEQSSPTGNGTVSYTVAPNTGAARAGTLMVAAQTVTITQEGSATPVAQDGAVATDEDEPVNGILEASSPTGATLTFAIVANGALGTAVVTNPATGAFTYTPHLNAFGEDTFTFTASNATSTSNVATVTVTITAVNDSPVAADGTLAVTEDLVATGTFAAADVDNPALTFSIVVNGSRGSATITDATTGAFSYVPNPQASGADTITFQASDGTLTSNVGTIAVTIAAVNDAPAASDGTLAVTEDVVATGTFAATDPDGPSLTFTIVSNGSRGTATITNPATGAFSYTPNANASGSDALTFQVSDGTLTSNVATLTIAITAVDDAPAAQNGALSVTAGGSASGSLVATDVDSSTLTFAIVTNGTMGTAVVTNATTGAYTYSANAGAFGTDTFTFRASDGTSNSNLATVTVTISSANQPPVAVNSSLTTPEDRSVSSTLVATDPERARLTFAIASPPARGTVTITNVSTGRFTYVPDANSNGVDSFTFTASDGTRTSNIATVSVTVTPVNDAPIVANLTLTTPANQPLTGFLQGADVEGSPLTYSVTRGPRRGTLSLVNALTGEFVYTPNPNFRGNDSFTFRASDGSATSNTATVGITVVP